MGDIGETLVYFWNPKELVQKGDDAIFNVCGGILFDSEVSSEYDIVP